MVSQQLKLKCTLYLKMAKTFDKIALKIEREKRTNWKIANILTQFIHQNVSTCFPIFLMISVQSIYGAIFCLDLFSLLVNYYHTCTHPVLNVAINIHNQQCCYKLAVLLLFLNWLHLILWLILVMTTRTVNIDA